VENTSAILFISDYNQKAKNGPIGTLIRYLIGWGFKWEHLNWPVA